MPGVLHQCSSFFLWNLLGVQMILWWICGGETGLPVLFLHHLWGTPQRKISSYAHIIACINFFSCVCVNSLQSCLTLCDPMDCSLPGFSVHGILQARILEWVAISFSKHFFSYCQVIIPFHGYITFHLFIYQLMDAWVISHMAIMKNAAKISIQVFVQT